MSPPVLRCPLCQTPDGWQFFVRAGVPAQDGVLWPTRDAALAAPRVDTRLALCCHCGGIWNDAYDPAVVGFTGYDVSTDGSATFLHFLEELASRLATTHAGAHQHVLDIACGRGTLLRMLCGLTGASGLGIDPNAPPDADGAVRFIRDYFGPRYGRLVKGFASCRQLIDLLPDPMGFLRMVRDCVASPQQTTFYFEVVDARPTFSGGVVWNVIHERRVWFTPGALQRALTRAGFRVDAVAPCWQGEYLGADCAAAEPRDTEALQADELAEAKQQLAMFAGQAESATTRLVEALEAAVARGDRVALWGAGARGVMVMVNEVASAAIGTVVDINPARQSLYLPLSGARVESPDILRESAPDLVIIANPTYGAEIMAHAGRLGITPRFMSA